MNCVDHGDLCVTAEEHPEDRNIILIRETEDENPEHTVRTTRPKFTEFVRRVKAGEFDDLTNVE